MPDIKNKNGDLSAYGLACGYIENYQAPRADVIVNLNLWKEHGIYHVRAHNHSEGIRIFWDSFLTLREARKRYNEGKAFLKNAPINELRKKESIKCK